MVMITIYDTSIFIKWVKLEVGTNAMHYTPLDPATEFLKCQRYYQIHSTVDIQAVDWYPTMRIIPTVT